LSQKWHKLFSTNYGTFPIDPKLAETAPLFCRVIDVPFLPKREHWANEMFGKRLGSERCTENYKLFMKQIVK